MILCLMCVGALVQDPPPALPLSGCGPPIPIPPRYCLRVDTYDTCGGALSTPNGFVSCCCEGPWQQEQEQ